METFNRWGNRLYSGETSIDFVGNRRWAYAFSAIFLALAAFGLFYNGLKMGIEFSGGVEYTISVQQGQATQETADIVRETVAGTGIEGATSPIVTTSGESAIRAQTGELDVSQTIQIRDAIAQRLGINGSEDISTQEVGASWGEQVVNRSLQGLVVFTILVTLMIWGFFREWKMAVGATVALAHDVVITVGIYALVGFEVTPATVTGVLTILGYSLYDTVVVFDKVRENTTVLAKATKENRQRTYAELANLAINQTLVRSINTSIVAILPVGALLYVGLFTLGAGSLKDLSLALFIGMIAGTYSSVFIATPLAVHLKENEPEISEQDRRARARAKRDAADRYAGVPALVEEIPHFERAGFDPRLGEDEDPQFAEDLGLEPDDEDYTDAPFQAPRYDAGTLGHGRVAPEAKAPIEESGAAKRRQPRRQPRSKRNK